MSDQNKQNHSTEAVSADENDAAAQGMNDNGQESAAPEKDESADVQKITAERDQYLELLKRTQAEFENYQKRVQKERIQERQYLIGAVFSELLPVLDNLERALAAAKDAGESGSLAQGVSLVYSQFLDLLQKNGVTPIESAGQTFDPNLHEALTQQPSADHPGNTVLHVVETGYKIHDRVLRPAKVVVSSEVKKEK